MKAQLFMRYAHIGRAHVTQDGKTWVDSIEGFNGYTDIDDPNNVLVYVNVYLNDRCYGGPEEGGWWYDTLEPVYCVPTTLDHAVKIREILEKEYSNEGRRPIESVLSEGVYVVYIQLHTPEYSPKEKPYYC